MAHTLCTYMHRNPIYGPGQPYVCIYCPDTLSQHPRCTHPSFLCAL